MGPGVQPDRQAVLRAAGLIFGVPASVMRRIDHGFVLRTGALAAISLLVACSGREVAGPASPPVATPPGITKVDVVYELLFSQPEYQWTRLGDAQGRTVFHFAAERSDRTPCVGDCAKEFPPLLAPSGAQAREPWGLVDQSGGRMQWSYRGNPLHTWSKETLPGQVAQNQVCEDKKGVKIAEFNFCDLPGERLLPPAGWTIARYEAAGGVVTPPGIAVKRLPAVLGDVLVDEDGSTLYAFDGEPEEDATACPVEQQPCRETWRPLLAPRLATKMADFTAVSRANGDRQWAFRGLPLYTFADDRESGDAKGEGTASRWHVALVNREFVPAAAQARYVRGRGYMLTSRDGQILYTRHPFEFRWGGRTVRGGFNNSYAVGKELGIQGCDEVCLQTWQPLAAPADAMASGYWEVLDRPGGARQWAYKGYALYVNKNDAPELATGNMIFEYVFGESDRYPLQAASIGLQRSSFGGGPGFFWHVAVP